MTRHIFLTLISVFILSYSVATANNPNIINFSRNDYHAGNKNWSLSEDEKGIMYIGNDLGLLEFDGIDWYLNKLHKADVVRAIYATSNQTIFTGGYEEFGRWDRDISGILKYTSLSDNLPGGRLHNDDIWRIWKKDNLVYFQSFKNIYIYDQNNVYKFPQEKNILFLMKVKDELWIQEMGGSLFKIVGNQYVKIPGSEIFSQTEVKTVLPTPDNKYIIGTSTMGLYIYNGSEFKVWNNNKALIDNNVNCGLAASNGNYYFGTILSGIYEVSPSGNITNHFNTETYLHNNTVLALYEDHSNNIWAGLDRGISCIQYLNGISCMTDPTGKIGAVYSAALYKGKLFIGTNQGVYYIEKNDLYSMNALSKFTLLPKTGGQIWNLNVIDDKLYCSHNQGLLIIDQNLSVTSPYTINTGVFYTMEKDKDHLLLGTYISLMSIDKKAQTLHILNEVQEPIKKVQTDHLNNVWLQHMNKGIYRTRLNDDFSKIESFKYYGHEDKQDIPYKLKLFKVGGRVAFLGNNKFYTYNDIEGTIVPEHALNECFSNIAGLKEVVNITPENFWIIGNDLIYNVIYADNKAQIKFIIDIGYKNFSMIDNYENIVTLDNDLSLICLDNGFLLCQNKVTAKNDPIAQPYFKSIKISNTNGESVYLDNNFNQISHSFNTIKFRFSTAETLTRNISFEYKLEGLDDQWHALRNQNSMTYERLPKGKYTFIVVATDRQGNKSEEIRFSFEILAPWHQSGWAVLAYCLLFIVFIASIILYIQYKYKKIHIKKLRLLETKRLNLINEHLQKEVEEKNAELLSQTSFIIQRNELILKIKNEVEEFSAKQNNKTLTPLYQKINTLLNSSLDSEEDWKTFLIKFEQKHTNFFKKIKETYPQLTANDLRLCACLKLNLDSKEIAALMNISVRAVENSRYRLRKKLDIPSHQHLNDFFLQI
ncbi:YXYXY domain-containing protein [Dysgonomonas alginatilytica]|uniref:YXYXY domain-containing protein n=1 Tax=Dysgonomonas alginatilytica TaxID=1605892 RepID=A0A2V3PNM8_9BACT|nr:triple tyrosine motif-containing protein [Dysgonomonas alginatilytica]PXV63548.1 YXYXY domain-containing protein [Dysgonomonas alginatilytica]